jgi:hypothetical protein
MQGPLGHCQPPALEALSRVSIRNSTPPSPPAPTQLPASSSAAARQTVRETARTPTRPHISTMLARGALCRLAAGVPKQAAHDLPKLASLVQTARAGVSLPIRTLPRLAQLQARSYATETVKKAVKAKAAAGKSVAKTTTEKKKPAAKPATKKKTTATTKKAAPKKTKKTKKKAAAPKRKAKMGRPAAVPTAEQKLTQDIANLRKVALLKGPVRRRALSAFNCYLQDNVAGTGGSGRSLKESQATLGELAAKWKTISPAEHEVFSNLLPASDID